MTSPNQPEPQGVPQQVPQEQSNAEQPNAYAGANPEYDAYQTASGPTQPTYQYPQYQQVPQNVGAQQQGTYGYPYAAGAPQQQYAPYGYPQTGYTNPADSGSFGWAVLGFFIPVVGLILWLVWKDQRPLDAAKAGKGALVSVIVWAVLMVLYFIFVIVIVAIAVSASNAWAFL